MRKYIQTPPNKVLKSLSVAAFSGLTFIGTQANAQDVLNDNTLSQSNLEGVITGAAAQVSPSEPTRGTRAVYTIENNAQDANTGIKFTSYSIDSETGDILSTADKYINITKTTYTKDGVQGTITYNWDEDTNRLTISPDNVVIKPSDHWNGPSQNHYSGLYMGNDYYDDLISRSAMDVVDTIDVTMIGNYDSPISLYDTRVREQFQADLIANEASEGGGIWSSGGFEPNADFIGNYAEYGGGGMINYGILPTVTGDFIANSTRSYGGGLFNHQGGNIYSLNGNFIGNSASSGGGIFNDCESEIGIITGDFIENLAKNQGGAIKNGNDIKTINGSFFANTANYGGAIYNTGTEIRKGAIIETINGHFVNNSATNSGGAIYNTGRTNSTNPLEFIGTIDKINGHFVGNRAGKFGGAIYNSSVGVLNKITGNFINNSVQDVDDDDYNDKMGGAIYNGGVIESIKGDFTGNQAVSQHDVKTYGGAIYNDANAFISRIEGNFTQNTASNEYENGFGGAIYNLGHIDTIKGDFTENTGGAIYNSAKDGNIASIDTIQGNFEKNVGHRVGGAAIHNSAESGSMATIDGIRGNFKNNTNYDQYDGGAVFVGANGKDAVASIGSITGDFTNNTAINAGGAIAVDSYSGAEASIGNIRGKFLNNKNMYANGGAISNTARTNLASSTIGDITGDFVNNTSRTHGGAIYNYSIADYSNGKSATAEIGDLSGYFTSNRAVNGGGGAIYNTAANVGAKSTIGNLEGNFQGNFAKYNGGAIYNDASDDGIANIGNIKGNFSGNNSELSGGAIYNESRRNGIATVGTIDGDFTNNSAKLYAGAIYNSGNMGEVKGSFTNNYVKNTTDDKLALGGAVYSNNADMTFVADGKQNIFSGNYTQDSRGKINNAIFVRTNKSATGTTPEEFVSPNITFDAKNNGSFVFDDTIDGGELNSGLTELKREHQYNLKLKGDSTGKITINNDILNANIEHNDVTTYVGGAKYLNHAQGEGINSLTMNSGELNIGSLALAPVHFEKFAMNGGTININSVDVDLANKTMGRITANNYAGTGNGIVNVKGMNVISDGAESVTPIKFADESFKNTVKTPVKEIYTELYKYDVSYDNSNKYGQDGYFVFTRGGGSDNSYQSYNPAVLTNATTVQTGGQTTMNNTFMYAFEHADIFSQFPAMERFAKINSNKFAIKDTNKSGGGFSTDFNSNIYTGSAASNRGVWVKPYSTFESIDLKNGPKVDTINYGTLIGFDSDFKTLKHGWANAASAYIGYNGSKLSYKGVDTTMNGGLLGLTETFYKGNFWTAITATAGAGVAESHTMYGKDDITMLMAGIGSKTGYNFEFNEGKFIIQPRLFLSYSFVNTFDYTNAAGVRIKSDPMHTIQLNPSIRFIGNIKQWQPYASVGMVWNLMNETQATANGVKLPEMHTRPYVEYGIGLQKHWNEKYSAYGQAMVRNGGRTGIALTFGFRMALGKDSTEKVQKEKPIPTAMKTLQTNKTNIVSINTDNEGQRKVIKQLSPTQKAHLLNSTRTAMAGVIK